VREICSHCKKEYVPSEELLKEFFEIPPMDIQWFRGQKCSLCDYTGYIGRIALAQIWTPNENDVILINKGAVIDELRKSSYQSTVFMIEDAVRLLRDGRTNLEELIRALPYSNIYESRQILKP
jgi:type II secretory ATPase GspE/PulE/Tfp pilus assembly ATPase PilB-like protein